MQLVASLAADPQPSLLEQVEGWAGFIGAWTLGILGVAIVLTLAGAVAVEALRDRWKREAEQQLRGAQAAVAEAELRLYEVQAEALADFSEELWRHRTECDS
ncbi:MAG: hypothetical protein AAGA90_00780 [Actinomycetota bacterium]